MTDTLTAPHRQVHADPFGAADALGRFGRRVAAAPDVRSALETVALLTPDVVPGARWASVSFEGWTAPGRGPGPAHGDGARSLLSLRLRVDPDRDPDAVLVLHGDGDGVLDEYSTRLAACVLTCASVAVGAVARRVEARAAEAALATERETGVAMGVLMATRKVTRAAAFELLRTVSRLDTTPCDLVAADLTTH